MLECITAPLGAGYTFYHGEKHDQPNAPDTPGFWPDAAVFHRDGNLRPVLSQGQPVAGAGGFSQEPGSGTEGFGGTQAPAGGRLRHAGHEDRE